MDCARQAKQLKTKSHDMKKLVYPLAAVVMLAASAFTFIANKDYSLGSGSVVKFTSADPTGTFKAMKGDISFDESNVPASKFNVTIDVNSISTGNAMRDKKALTEEWFNEPKFKNISFNSTKVEEANGMYQITGNLKMKGVTKTVTVPAKFSDNRFFGTFKVDRLQFGVGKKSDVVPDVMKIDYSFPVVAK
jgi:polyisoprenoid-binding protein YceI